MATIAVEAKTASYDEETMMTRLFAVAALICLSMVAFADNHPGEVAAIGQVIDDFHAAADADAKRYLGHLTKDAVFMGTDEWERWPKHPDFTEYVNTRFADGGWHYQSVERHVVMAPTGGSAWFDEVIYSQTNGRFRGTGVAVKTEAGWKIAHYAMSFLVLNENWEDVVELTRSTKQKMKEQQSQ